MICATINARAAIMESVQSAGRKFLRDGSTAELEQRKTVLHAKVSSAVRFHHTASAQTFSFDLIVNIQSFDSFIVENLIVKIIDFYHSFAIEGDVLYFYDIR